MLGGSMQLFLRTAGTAGGRGHRKVVLPELEKPQAGRVFDYSRVLSCRSPACFVLPIVPPRCGELLDSWVALEYYRELRRLKEDCLDVQVLADVLPSANSRARH